MVSAFIAPAALSILTIAGPAWAQTVNAADTVRKGHDLAAVACSNCHQVAVDQRARRAGRPAPASPAPCISFFRHGAAWITAHAEPYLLEYQVQEVVLNLSLRK